MAMVGFDPQKVTSSMNSVESAYNDLMKALYTDMQSQFVNAMANYWACKEAQKFFTNDFKPAIDELLAGSHTTFESVIKSMNSSADSWAKTTGSTWTPKTFSGSKKIIAVTCIKENINGVRGAEPQQAITTANKLNTIKANAETALTKAKTAVSSCGFVGGDQQARINASLDTIKSNISGTTAKLTSAINKAVSSTVDAYGTLAAKVSDAFTAK